MPDEFEFRLDGETPGEMLDQMKCHIKALELVTAEVVNVLHHVNPGALDEAVRQARLDYQADTLRPLPTDQRQERLVRRFGALRLYLLETPECRQKLSEHR